MDCSEHIEKLWFLVVIIWVVGSRLLKMLKQASGGQQPQPQPPASDFQIIDETYGEDEYGDEALGLSPAPQVAQVTAPVTEDPWAKPRQELEDRITRLRRRAADMESRLNRERPNRRFLEVPQVYVPGLLEQARETLVESTLGGQEQADVIAERLRDADLIVQDAAWILDVIDTLAQQRRHPELAAMLGDADHLAEACYRPVLTFARAEGLPITSNHPAVSFGRFDLQIWTGLIPTSVAPIFLPPGFFEKAAWWPALAHEIGHDFYNSIDGFDAGVRRDLGLPSQQRAVQILRSPEHGLELSELEGLFGAWIEEIFCDVFGLMMTGPAYLATMIDLFASEHDPSLVASVPITREERTEYDSHPPRHLRVLMAASLLSELGLQAEATALREEWDARHTYEDGAIDFLVLPTLSGKVAIGLEPFEQLGRTLVQRLYRGPLAALAGRGLRDVAGLDYGTHRHQETLRARESLLHGVAPGARDPRPIIAAAVLAARAAPRRESTIVRLARDAIPALGTSETWSQVPAAVGVGDNPLAAPLQADDVFDGVVLNAILTGRPGGHGARRVL